LEEARGWKKEPEARGLKIAEPEKKQEDGANPAPNPFPQGERQTASSPPGAHADQVH